MRLAVRSAAGGSFKKVEFFFFSWRVGVRKFNHRQRIDTAQAQTNDVRADGADFVFPLICVYVDSLLLPLSVARARVIGLSRSLSLYRAEDVFVVEEEGRKRGETRDVFPFGEKK